MKRVSKAVAAGVSAGVAAAGVYLQARSFQLDAESIGGAVGAFFATGVTVGLTTYFAPANKPA